jgi:hypothetical protein
VQRRNRKIFRTRVRWRQWRFKSDNFLVQRTKVGSFCGFPSLDLETKIFCFWPILWFKSWAYIFVYLRWVTLQRYSLVKTISSGGSKIIKWDSDNFRAQILRWKLTFRSGPEFLFFRKFIIFKSFTGLGRFSLFYRVFERQIIARSKVKYTCYYYRRVLSWCTFSLVQIQISPFNYRCFGFIRSG